MGKAGLIVAWIVMLGLIVFGAWGLSTLWKGGFADVNQPAWKTVGYGVQTDDSGRMWQVQKLEDYNVYRAFPPGSYQAYELPTNGPIINGQVVKPMLTNSNTKLKIMLS
jgi:hypothetical protein